MKHVFSTEDDCLKEMNAVYGGYHKEICYHALADSVRMKGISQKGR